MIDGQSGVRHAFLWNGRSKMRKLVMTVMLLALATSPAAISQTGNQPNGASSNKGGGPWPAPVGHRQPRVDQVPSEKNLSDPNNPVNREDAALDKSIKSICRGC
jgi:hypothetical protein